MSGVRGLMDTILMSAKAFFSPKASAGVLYKEHLEFGPVNLNTITN